VKHAQSCTRAPRWRVSAHPLLLAAAAAAALLLTLTAHAATGVTISGTPPASVKAGSTYSFTPSASTTHTGRALAFAIVGKPTWATFNSKTGTLAGTPSAANVGRYANVEIAVNDGLSSAVLNAFAITVLASSSNPGSPTPPPGPGNPSTPLTISGTPPATVGASSAYTFTPVTHDTHTGRTLAFAIVGKPSWATFNSKTGTLAGTPSAANVGRYPNVEIVVNDGLSSAVLPAFAITVQASSGASSTVKLSGTPATSVVAGRAYAFQPTATDSAGKALAFSVANKPAWATFSISTGLLSGTPSSSQSGSYANITVTASDGSASGSLAPFTITVTAPQSSSGSATLSWINPTLNTNGTALTDLAGIHIYYGTSPSSLNNMVDVTGTGETSYTISNLPAGTWYFAATAYTSGGVESGLSQVNSKTIS